MKVLIIRPFPEKLDINNYNVQEIGLAEALQRLNIQCDIVFFNGKKSDNIQTLKSGVRIFWLRGISFCRNGFFPEVEKICSDYDVLQVQEYDQYQSWRLYSRTIKPVVIYHGPYECEFNRGYNLRNKVFDLLFLHKYPKCLSDTICLTKSPLAEKYLRKKGFSEVEAVGVGLAPEMLCVRAVAGKDKTHETGGMADSMPESAINILYVGVLEERRNTEFLISVMKRFGESEKNSETNHPVVHFTVIGSGKSTYLSKISNDMKYLEEVGIMKWYRRAGQSELGEIYSKADFLLFPTKYDIFGMVLLEAMYYGVVCISTENGGSATLIKNGQNGCILSADRSGDSENWYNTILKTANDNDLYQKMSANARNTVKSLYTWDRLAPKFCDAYIRALKNSGKRTEIPSCDTETEEKRER